MRHLICCCLILTIHASETPYSWQTPMSTVDPTGHLAWAPAPRVFSPGPVIRCIDYATGNDDNPGTREAPWRHHPWDRQATGRAAAWHGPTTYLFKGGVSYRGQLLADESGRPDQPILLTSDPSWGQGPAVIAGSSPLSGTWTRANDPRFTTDLPIWRIATDLRVRPRGCWQVVDDDWRRLSLAREPDEDPGKDPRLQRADWATWTSVEQVAADDRARNLAACPAIFTASDANAYDGALIWTNYPAFMGSPYATPLQDYLPEQHAVRLQSLYYGGGPALRPGNRFFVEDHPRFLDHPGEWWFDAADGSLYLVSQDDPNQQRYEIAQHYTQIDIRDRSSIHIDGLTFRGANTWDPTQRSFEDPDVRSASIRVLGTASHISVRHCVFSHVATAIRMHAVGDGDRLDEILIADNDISHALHAGIDIADGAAWGKQGPEIGTLGRVDILRNRLRDIGLRPSRSDHGHALRLRHASLSEVAGNIIERSGGAGIYCFGGKGGDQRDAPLVRLLIHHNSVRDALLLTTDWGGIEAWQGGPIAIWNNVSGGVQGIWDSYRADYLAGERHEEGPMHESPTGCGFGFAYYLDGAYQSAVFNNIAWSASNDGSDRLASTSAFMETMGFQNAWFNNTASNFPVAFSNFWGSKQGMAYLGNRIDRLGLHLAYHTLALDDPLFRFPRIAWSRNLIAGQPAPLARWGAVRGSVSDDADLAAMRQTLQGHGSLIADVGEQVDEALIVDLQDFRPEGPRGQAARFFVPWGLAREVGRWHFRATSDPRLIADEHWYLDPAHRHRGMYHELPRHDFTIQGEAPPSWIDGPLEDWCTGALRCDGRETWAVLRDADLEAPVVYQEGEETVTINERAHIDAELGNLLIEVYLRLPLDGGPGLLLKKQDDEHGWRIDCAADGSLTLALRSNGHDRCQRASLPLRDGRWHHVLVEVDRDAPSGIDWYIDGRPANQPFVGQALPRHWTLSNGGDLLLAGGPDETALAVDLEFLRLAHGTLADARTDIDELSTWQFDGPALRDFLGRLRPTDSTAGAIEQRAPDAP